MRLSPGRLLAPGLAILLTVLAACTPVTVPPVAPSVSPKPAEAPPAPIPAPEPSAQSIALKQRYAHLQSDMLAKGLMRTDGGGPDTPFDADQLARNFLRIALYDEFVPSSGQIVARETTSRLRRWEAPVNLQVEFGPSVPKERRAEDRQTIAELATRLEGASRHAVRPVGGGGNFTIYVVNEDERRALGDRLRAEIPGISSTVVRTITEMPDSTFCMVIAFSGDDRPYVYQRAIAVVRDEHPPLLRRSCMHEEIAQGLGLANDSPSVRPSIFNDDEEFALLTSQDDLMLRMLYDPRFAPGMSLEEATPIAQTVATELLPPPVMEATEAKES